MERCNTLRLSFLAHGWWLWLPWSPSVTSILDNGRVRSVFAWRTNKLYLKQAAQRSCLHRGKFWKVENWDWCKCSNKYIVGIVGRLWHIRRWFISQIQNKHIIIHCSILLQTCLSFYSSHLEVLKKNVVKSFPWQWSLWGSKLQSTTNHRAGRTTFTSFWLVAWSATWVAGWCDALASSISKFFLYKWKPAIFQRTYEYDYKGVDFIAIDQMRLIISRDCPYSTIKFK